MTTSIRAATRVVGTAALVTVLLSGSAFALGRVKSPQVHKGELELEYQTVYQHDDRASKNGKQEHEFELEYGLTDRFAMELAGELENGAGPATTKFKKIEVAGQYQFSETGEYWIDTGVQLAYAQAFHSADANAIEGKLLLQKDMGKFSHIANLGLEHEVGAGSSDGLERKAAISSRYRYSKYFEPAIEWQANFGKASDHFSYSEQEHFVGPALYGQIIDGVKYEAAYYFGASKAAADGAGRFFIEYELYF